MNRTKIEWVDYTWNPWTGCTNGCSYCYARRVTKRFEPVRKFSDLKFYPERLDQPVEVKKPSTVMFSMMDFFDSAAPAEWREKVIEKVEQYNQHLFFALTKVSENIPANFNVPDNLWIGVSAEDFTNVFARVARMTGKGYRFKKFISIEPILGEVHKALRRMLRYLSWVIVGPMTGPNKKPCEQGWIDDVVKVCEEAGTPVFVKKMADGSEPPPEWRQWPEEVIKQKSKLTIRSSD